MLVSQNHSAYIVNMMNDFNNLSAENEMSALAMVAPEEVAGDWEGAFGPVCVGLDDDNLTF